MTEDELTKYMRALFTAHPPKWWAPYWPFYNNKSIRLFTVTFFKGSVMAKPITKKHLFDLLLDAHSRRIVGFQIWY